MVAFSGLSWQGALATSTGQNDANSGGDAGNSRSQATLVLLGTHNGQLVSNDEDWYVSSSAVTSLICVDGRANGEQPAWLTVGAENGNGRKATSYLPAGGSARAGVAVDSLSTAVIALGPKNADNAPFGYQFTLGTVGLPDPSLGDALTGADAGSSVASALAITTPCVGGRLNTVSGVSDLVDYYAVTVNTGDVVTYSFATGGIQTATLTLKDAAGNAMGPTITTDGSAVSEVLESGTYYLVASRSSGTDSLGYLIGTAIGPPDQNGCRPYC